MRIIISNSSTTAGRVILKIIIENITIKISATVSYSCLADTGNTQTFRKQRMTSVTKNNCFSLYVKDANDVCHSVKN